MKSCREELFSARTIDFLLYIHFIFALLITILFSYLWKYTFRTEKALLLIFGIISIEFAPLRLLIYFQAFQVKPLCLSFYIRSP